MKAKAKTKAEIARTNPRRRLKIMERTAPTKANAIANCSGGSFVRKSAAR